MEYQVRRYQIAQGELEAFSRAWRSGVVPLRERFGFEIVGGWEIEETNEFVWILGHDDPAGFGAADAAYYESDERERLSPDPARHVVSMLEQDAVRVV